MQGALGSRRGTRLVLDQDNDRGAVVVEQNQVLTPVAIDVGGAQGADVPVELGDLRAVKRRNLTGVGRQRPREQRKDRDPQQAAIHGFGARVRTTARRLVSSMTMMLQLLPKYFANTSGDGARSGSVKRASARTSASAASGSSPASIAAARACCTFASMPAPRMASTPGTTTASTDAMS